VPGVEWHACDLLDGPQVDQLLDQVRPTHLLHFAWYATPPDYWTATENVSWAEAGLGLLRRFGATGGERAVLAGTCAEYDLSHGYCSELLTPLRPVSLYGACKHALQTVTAEAGDALGLSTAWGRIFHLYGPAEHPSRLVASVISALLAGDPAPCSHGRQVRDFLHAEDVASAFVSLLDSGVEGPVNISSGVPVTIGTVASTIGTLVGRPELIRLGARAAPPGEPPVILADVRRLQAEVGWEPRHSLESGLEATISWWRDTLSVTQRLVNPRPDAAPD
jgi:nucleoside-diphosphate-sugar epimerase